MFSILLAILKLKRKEISMNDLVLALGRYFSCDTKFIHPKMEQSSSNLIKVDSLSTWNFHVNQATDQACPVVAHFTAEWCMPSVAMNPLMEELASNYPNMLFLSVDVDDVKEVAKKYEVKAMPTFVLMKDGAQVDKLVGANPEEIRKRVASLIESSHAINVE